MNKLQRKAVVKEFELYLDPHSNNENSEIYKKEVRYCDIMDTERQFRADYCIPAMGILIEINGGQWINGRHNRAGKVKGKEMTQYEDDLMKLNIAQHYGYVVYQFTYEMLMRKEYERFL